jgi:hypothetical protein
LDHKSNRKGAPAQLIRDVVLDSERREPISQIPIGNTRRASSAFSTALARSCQCSLGGFIRRFLIAL